MFVYDGSFRYDVSMAYCQCVPEVDKIQEVSLTFLSDEFAALYLFLSLSKGILISADSAGAHCCSNLVGRAGMIVLMLRDFSYYRNIFWDATISDPEFKDFSQYYVIISSKSPLKCMRF